MFQFFTQWAPRIITRLLPQSLFHTKHLQCLLLIPLPRKSGCISELISTRSTTVFFGSTGRQYYLITSMMPGLLSPTFSCLLFTSSLLLRLSLLHLFLVGCPVLYYTKFRSAVVYTTEPLLHRIPMTGTFTEP